MREVEEAWAWLAGARHLLDAEMERERLTVSVSMCIHSIIRANDALTMRFLRRRSTRHEDAGMLFREMVRQKKINPKYAGLGKVLARAIPHKSLYDYKGEEVVKKDAEKWVHEVDRFILTVEEILSSE